MDWSGISGSSAKSTLVREGNTVNALMAMLCSSPQPGYFRGFEGRLSSGTSLKRPLFPSSDVDGLVEDDITDHHEQSIHVEKKRKLTVEQVRCLEKSFEEENKLETERKLQLAQELSLQPRQVAVWFQNRRARWKAKQLEQDYEILQMEYDALLLEKKKLEAEVFSLSDKLAAKEHAASKTGRGNNSGCFDSQQYSSSDIQTSLNIENQVIVSSELHASSSPVTEEAKGYPIQPSIEEYSPQSDIYNSQLLDAGSPHPVDTSLDTQESAGIVFEQKTRNNHTLQALTYYAVGEEGPYVSLHNNQVYEQIACKLENGLFYDGHEYHHSNTPEEPAFLAWWYSP